MDEFDNDIEETEQRMCSELHSPLWLPLQAEGIIHCCGLRFSMHYGTHICLQADGKGTSEADVCML